jgi:hypothetical protein
VREFLPSPVLLAGQPLLSQIDIVVVGEMLAKSVDAMRLNEHPRFLDFRIDQQKIPKALEGVKQESRLAVEETKSEYISVNEIEDAAQIERRLGEHAVAQKAFPL